MLIDPHPSLQHAGLHHAVWQPHQEVTRPTSPKKSGVDGGANRWQHILVSCFTCTPHGDLVQLLHPPIIALVGSVDRKTSYLYVQMLVFQLILYNYDHQLKIKTKVWRAFENSYWTTIKALALLSLSTHLSTTIYKLCRVSCFLGCSVLQQKAALGLFKSRYNKSAESIFPRKSESFYYSQT